MVKVVEQLAEITGYKDRDVMDVTLAIALRDMLLPLSITIFRAVGQPNDLRWMTRARLVHGDVVPTADSLSAPIESLPKLDLHPARQACLLRHEVHESSAQNEYTCHFPMMSEHDGDGVLEVVSRTRLAPAEQRTVSAIVKVYHNFQGLLDYSERDSLTGLLNRKTFDTAFLKMLGGQANMGSMAGAGDDRRQVGAPAYWLGVIDIDHFKRVNDNFGHLIGDEVLLLLSRLMRTSFRFHDRLYRFGGEEFVVLLRSDSAEDAMLAFERLRLTCATFQFPQVGQVTLSVGVTAVRLGDSPTSAFDRADKAVYHAKHNGRNQVHCFEQLVADGHLKDEGLKTSDVELF